MTARKSVEAKDVKGWMARPLVHVSVTTACSLRCEYCPVLDHLIDAPTDALMDDPELLRVIDVSAPMTLLTSGGEPFLHPAFPDFVKRAGNKGHKFIIDSNGTFSRRKITELLSGLDPEWIHYVDLSHHIQQGVPLDRMIETAMAIMDFGIPCYIKQIAIPEHIFDIQKSGDVLKSLKIGHCVSPFLSNYWRGRRLPEDYSVSEIIDIANLTVYGSCIVQIFGGFYSRGVPCKGGREGISWNPINDGTHWPCCHGQSVPVDLEESFVHGQRGLTPCAMEICAGSGYYSFGYNDFGQTPEYGALAGLLNGDMEPVGVDGAMDYIDTIIAGGHRIVREHAYRRFKTEVAERRSAFGSPSATRRKLAEGRALSPEPQAHAELVVPIVTRLGLRADAEIVSASGPASGESFAPASRIVCDNRSYAHARRLGRIHLADTLLQRARAGRIQLWLTGSVAAGDIVVRTADSAATGLANDTTRHYRQGDGVFTFAADVTVPPETLGDFGIDLFMPAGVLVDVTILSCYATEWKDHKAGASEAGSQAAFAAPERDDGPSYDVYRDHRDVVSRIGGDVPGLLDLPVSEQVIRLRQWVGATLINATTPDTLVAQIDDLDRRPTMDLLRAFDRGDGGIWCSGAAFLLHRVYRAFGLESWVLSYGIRREAYPTHAVALVRTPKGIFVQDAYFNLHYEDDDGAMIDVFAHLDRIGQGKAASIAVDAAVRRTVLYPRGIDPAGVWPAEDGACEADFQVDPAHPNWLVGRSAPDLSRYLRLHPKIKPTFMFFRRKGLLPNLQSLLCFPFALHDGKSYTEDVGRSPLLADLCARASDVRRTLQNGDTRR